ncbi:MAG: hypothetical protein Q9218_001186 [Villophora microphyllina]
MFRGRPTVIRLTANECLSPSQRGDAINNGFICETYWTKLMLLRLQQLDHSGLAETDIFIRLREEFNAPAAIEELRQERAFLKIGPTKGAFWTPAMEKYVIESSKQGKNAQEITKELLEVKKRPALWTETYRKIQQLKLDGIID